MAVIIYHNPRCSKSRQTLELITESGAAHTVVLYRDDTPDAETIVGLAEKLGLSVADLLRRGESEFKEATDLPDLEDNIVVHNASGKAVMGRPPENVLQLLS